MQNNIEFIKDDFERAEYLLNMLITFSTGGQAEESDYTQIRRHFLSNPMYENLIPRWIKTNRNLDQFWQFIKHEYSSYAERRRFLWEQLNPLLEYLETKQTLPAEKSINEVLSRFDAEDINYTWQKALERKTHDPEGAITISRSILESVCKHILLEQSIEFNENNIELSELYKLTAKELNLSPDRHSEQIFKQILGGCSGIVNGLGALRNKHGDAHGSSPSKVKPKPRHAELAVNLAGTMALFLISTYEAKNT